MKPHVNPRLRHENRLIAMAIVLLIGWLISTVADATEKHHKSKDKDEEVEVVLTAGSGSHSTSGGSTSGSSSTSEATGGSVVVNNYYPAPEEPVVDDAGQAVPAQAGVDETTGQVFTGPFAFQSRIDGKGNPVLVIYRNGQPLQVLSAQGNWLKAKVFIKKFGLR